jgi:putative colanic acid biosynthesis UDP-glucose lipid carrier transferase
MSRSGRGRFENLSLGLPTQPISSLRLAALSALLMLTDVGVFVLAFDCSVRALRRIPTGIPHLTPTLMLSAVILLGAMIWSGAYSELGADRLGTHLARVFLICTAVFGLLLLVGSASDTSEFAVRLPLLGWYLASLTGLTVVRLAAHTAAERWRQCGKFARTAAVVDIAGGGATLARRIQRSDASELCFIGLFSRESSSGYGIDDLVQLTRERRIDDVILAAGGASDAEVGAALEKLGAVSSNVHICTTIRQTSGVRPEPSLVFGHPVLTVHRRPLEGWAAVAKRLEDVLLGGFILLLWLPVMGVLAVFIRLDSPGPVLFRQKRLGRNNTVFEIIKFRTMIHRPEPEGDVPQARLNDPRVTRLGRLLRRASLDELPQLFNVIRGDMSLVGPRPHAIPHNQYYSSLIDGYWARHRVRPGITGWAQVHGFRGETDTLEKMRRRVEFDLAYIRRWSLLLDAQVLLKTVIVCFWGSAAH